MLSVTEPHSKNMCFDHPEWRPLNPIARSYELDSLPRSVFGLSEVLIGLSSAGTDPMYLAFCTGGSFLLIV